MKRKRERHFSSVCWQWWWWTGVRAGKRKQIWWDGDKNKINSLNFILWLVFICSYKTERFFRHEWEKISEAEQLKKKTERSPSRRQRTGEGWEGPILREQGRNAERRGRSPIRMRKVRRIWDGMTKEWGWMTCSRVRNGVRKRRESDRKDRKNVWTKWRWRLKAGRRLGRRRETAVLWSFLCECEARGGAQGSGNAPRLILPNPDHLRPTGGAGGLEMLGGDYSSVQEGVQVGRWVTNVGGRWLSMERPQRPFRQTIVTATWHRVGQIESEIMANPLSLLSNLLVPLTSLTDLEKEKSDFEKVVKD